MRYGLRVTWSCSGVHARGSQRAACSAMRALFAAMRCWRRAARSSDAVGTCTFAAAAARAALSAAASSKCARYPATPLYAPCRGSSGNGTNSTGSRGANRRSRCGGSWHDITAQKKHTLNHFKEKRKLKKGRTTSQKNMQSSSSVGNGQTALSTAASSALHDTRISSISVITSSW